MKKNRTVCSLLCATMLLTTLNSCSINKEQYELSKTHSDLVDQISEDCNIDFENLYYASTAYEFGCYNLMLLTYKKPSIFANEYERKNPYYKIDYNISNEEYTNFCEIANGNEILFPFNIDVLNIIKKITNEKTADSINKASLTDNGKQIIDEIKEKYN